MKPILTLTFIIRGEKMLTNTRLKRLSQATSKEYEGREVRVPTKVWRTGSVCSHGTVKLSPTMAKDVARTIRKIANNLLKDER